jgi:hypothetical protein
MRSSLRTYIPRLGEATTSRAMPARIGSWFDSSYRIKLMNRMWQPASWILVGMLAHGAVIHRGYTQGSGGGPPGGSVQALAIDRLNPNTVYAGTAYSGIFKSTDGGATRMSSNSGLGAEFNVQALAIDPVSSSTVYAGTGCNGVFKSTNGGASWSPVNSGFTAGAVLSLSIDVGNPATLYIGSNGGGVFKTTNGGASWAAANTGLSTSYNNSLLNYPVTTIRSLAIDPLTPATVFAGTATAGVFKSTDGGAT